MIEKLKNLFKRKNNDKKDLSKEALSDQQKIIDKQNEAVNKFSKVYLENTELINSKKEEMRTCDEASKILCEKDINDLQKQIDEQKLNIERQKQGKKKDIISSYFMQLDKRIHNKLFNRKRFGNFLWKNYKKCVNARYNDLGMYIARNTGIAVGVGVIGSLVNLPLFLTVGACSLIGGITAVKGISTNYNNKHFGGPLLKRFKTVFTGKYKENIATSKFAYEKANELSCDSIISSLNRPVVGEIDEEEVEQEEQREEQQELTPRLEEKEREVEKFRRDFRELLQENAEEYQEDREYKGLGIVIGSNDMDYITAYSTIRKSTDEKERIDAYYKLANTYGKNNKTKKETEIKKLNYYSRRLKALSEYGKKVNSGNATMEETEAYLALLYNLGKDFDEDDVIDYLSGVYEQLAEEEREKVLRKAS